MLNGVTFVIINLKNDDMNILGIYDFLYRKFPWLIEYRFGDSNFSYIVQKAYAIILFYSLSVLSFISITLAKACDISDARMMLSCCFCFNESIWSLYR